MKDLTFGRSYLIDYYALLGVNRDDPDAVIAGAARDKLIQYHPDNINPRAADDIRRRSAGRFALFTEARDVLRDHRAEYDALLESWEGPVSTDGTPIMVIGGAPQRSLAMTTSFDALDQALTKIEAQVRAMTGYEPAILDLLNQQMQDSEDPSPALARAYLAALEARDRYLAILESKHLEALGLSGQTGHSVPSNYVDAAQLAIESGREQFSGAVQEHLALGNVEVKALSAGSGAEDISDSAALEQWAADRLQAFDVLAERAMALAAERSEVIAARLAQVRPVYSPDQPTLHPRLALCVNNEIWLLFEVKSSKPFTLQQIDTDTSHLGSLNEAGIADLIANGTSVAYLETADGLPILDQIQAAVSLHFHHFIGHGGG